jgi:hypothetical protein
LLHKALNYATRTTVGLGAENVDFTAAAENAVHTVVHVKNVSTRTVYNPIILLWFAWWVFSRKQIGTGSVHNFARRLYCN